MERLFAVEPNVPQFWNGAHYPCFPPFTAVAGEGRSFNLGVSIDF